MTFPFPSLPPSAPPLTKKKKKAEEEELRTVKIRVTDLVTK